MCIEHGIVFYEYVILHTRELVVGSAKNVDIYKFTLFVVSVSFSLYEQLNICASAS